MSKLSRSGSGFTALILFFTLAATATIADTVPARLAAARSAAEQGHHSEALSIYGEFIAAHPMMQTVFVRKDELQPPSQVHDLLLAFAEMTELQRVSGDEKARQERLDKLDWLWRNRSIRAINLYHLARVYLDNGRQEQGLEALEKIASDQERLPRKEHNKVYLRACTRLLEVHSERNRPDKLQNVLMRLKRSLGLFSYDLRDRYKVARLLLEEGAEEEAEPVLEEIAGQSDPSVLREEEFTIVQAAIKLLGLYAGRNDNQAIDRLLKGMEKRFADRPMTQRNRHLLALAVERSGHAPVALQ